MRRAALAALLTLLAGLGSLAASAPGPGGLTPPGSPNTADGSPAAADPDEKPRVKLVVLVVFDQMRGDYLEKWKPLFGPGGFARLQADGAWFTNCHYPYAT